MTEKDLIKQLKELRVIKPNQDWVLLTKRQILPEEESVQHSVLRIFAVFQWKLAFAPIVSVFIVIGLLGFTQKTVPGDFLFTVKKMTEDAQVGLSSVAEKPAVHLKMANKRLEDLNKIAEANQVRSLAPAIEEIQKQLDEVDIVDMTKEIVEETRKFEENRQKIETILGIKIDTEKYNNTLEQYTAYLIADLENRTLSEEDRGLLSEAKDAFGAGDYALALEKLWVLSNK